MEAPSTGLRMNLFDRLRPLAAIDLRSLALFRVVLGIAVLLNVVLLWPDAAIFLADEGGLYTRAMALDDQAPWRWSLLFAGGTPAFLHAALLLNGLAGLALLLGWRTRLATVVCWLFALSFKHRAMLYLSLADTQLPILLFWAMFLPLGARFSVDAALDRRPPVERDVVSVASLAVLLNVMYLYFVGALEKTGASWQVEHSAVFLAISSVETSSPLAPLLVQFPTLCAALTQFVYAVELAAPLLLFLPFATQWVRLFGVPFLMSLHLAFVLFLSIGIFPWVSLAGLCLFLPALLWDRVLRPWNDRPARRGIVMYYDRDCGFCEKTCRLFRAFGMHPETRIVPAQDEAEIGALLERENSWVVRGHDGRLRLRWDAVAYVWRRSPLLAPLGWLSALPGLSALGNVLYRAIGAGRGRLARLTALLLPWRELPPPRPGLAVSLLLALLIPLSAWSCLQHPLRGTLPRMPAPLAAPLDVLALSQRWNMYAPNAPRRSRWIVAEGQTYDGRTVDALRRREETPAHDRPASGYDLHRSFRWRKLLSRVVWPVQGQRLAVHHCTRWDAAHPQAPLRSIRYVEYRQRTVLPGQSPVPAQRFDRGSFGCHPQEETLDALLDELDR